MLWGKGHVPNSAKYWVQSVKHRRAKSSGDPFIYIFRLGDAMGIAIQHMFDGIARRYDFLNHFLSAGRDKAWRRKAARLLRGGPSMRVLDLCGGTGDFWKTWQDQQSGSKQTKRPFGVIADFSLPMLMEARRKFSAPTESDPTLSDPTLSDPILSDPILSDPILSDRTRSVPAQAIPPIVRMDALKPCFKPGAFDAVICAYGMRNLDSVGSGMDEVGRLLKPGGMFITLEFFRPTTLFTHFFYNGLAPLSIPFLGWFFSSRREAYAYLVDSIRGFKSVSEYGECARGRGFKDVRVIPCDFGISHIVTAVKG
jgi:demethylmenaquinone methyltransferase/2-methoxy-6-polyprenyl-1,4-benzoquinol methylase